MEILGALNQSFQPISDTVSLLEGHVFMIAHHGESRESWLFLTHFSQHSLSVCFKPWGAGAEEEREGELESFDLTGVLITWLRVLQVSRLL